MSLDFFKEFLAKQNITINDVVWNKLVQKVERREFKKNEFILEQGKVENYLSFVESGAARLYGTKGSKDITIKIVFENSYLTAYDSLILRTPSRYHVQALTDLVIWSIEYSNLKKFHETPEGNLTGRVAAENLYLEKAERELSLLFDTAEERYLSLFKKNPKLIREVPLKYIAEYIGITPQALSRIRARIT